MIVLNFSHPITEEHKEQLQKIANVGVKRVIEIHTQLDLNQPLWPQIENLVNQIDLTPEEWQKEYLVFIPPGLSVAAVMVVMALYSKSQRFLPMVVMRPQKGVTPPRFEVGEIVVLTL